MANPTFQTTMLSLQALTTTPKTVAWTLDAGVNRRVFVVYGGGNTYPPSIVTYAGVSLVEIGSYSDVKVWSGLIPDSITGSQNLITTCGGTPAGDFYAFSVKDAGYPDSITWDAGTIYASGSTLVQSKVSRLDQLIVGIYRWGINFGYGANSGITVRFCDPVNGNAGSYKVMGTAAGTGGSVTFSLTMAMGSSDRSYIQGIFAISPPENGGVSVSVINENGVAI